MLGKIHLILGPAVMFLALINGGLGFNLAGNSHYSIPYAAVVVILGLLFVAIRAWLLFRNVPRTYKPDRESIDEYLVQHTTYPSPGIPTPYSFQTSSYKGMDSAGLPSAEWEMGDQEMFLPDQHQHQQLDVPPPPKLTLQTGYERVEQGGSDVRYA